MAASIIQISEQRGHQRGKAEGHAEGHLEGKAEGHLEGKAEGHLEGKRETILQVLRLQFQAVPEPIVQHITAIDSVSDLDALLGKCLKAKRLEDIL